MYNNEYYLAIHIEEVGQMSKCKFCGCGGATEPICDEKGKGYLICESCDDKSEWRRG